MSAAGAAVIRTHAQHVMRATGKNNEGKRKKRVDTAISTRFTR
jgi:hypothetical protein